LLRCSTVPFVAFGCSVRVWLNVSVVGLLLVVIVVVVVVVYVYRCCCYVWVVRFVVLRLLFLPVVYSRLRLPCVLVVRCFTLFVGCCCCSLFCRFRERVVVSR
jgi:hypothetical protein